MRTSRGGNRPPEWDRLAAEFLRQARQDDAPCHICGQPIHYGAPPNDPRGPTADHLNPIGLGGILLTQDLAAAHRSCNSSHGAKIGNILRRSAKPKPDTPTPIAPSPVPVPRNGGVIDVPPEVLQVPWLRPLLPVPDEGTWPRLMTPAHPRAVGTLGWDVIGRVERRRQIDPMVPKKGKGLRWWQKLLLVRMYEVDADNQLVWPNIVISTSRQVGKSVALREIALDRMTQADHYGEAQLVLHTAKDLAIADEIQRPARQWAGIMEEGNQPWHPIGAAGRWAVEYNGVMGRWLIRAQHAVYGFSASTALVDEGWAIDVGPVAEGLEPTMVEREQPQLLIVSTAHSKATELMPWWRGRGIAQMDDPEDVLMMEWSAAPEAAADKSNPLYHRMASPHWDERRARFIASRVMEDGFTEQWLNIWPSLNEQVETMVRRELWDSMGDPALQVPIHAASGHTIALYPNVTQSVWYALQAGVDTEMNPSLRVIGSYPSAKTALNEIGQITRHAPCDLIIPRFIRGRIPKMAGVRSLIQAGESDVAAATTTVRPWITSRKLRHDGSEVLAGQMPRAVIDRYGDTIRISGKASEVPVEAAKAAVLAVWWASRMDRPRAVVV